MTDLIQPDSTRLTRASDDDANATVRPAPKAGDIEFELAVGLAQLTQTLAGNTALSSEQALLAMLNQFVQALPGTTAASITARPHTKKPPVTLCSTHQHAGEVDELQYQVGQGPCLDAFSTRELIEVGNLTEDERWPDFGSLARQSTPMRSVLSVPIPTGTASQSLNFYADQPQAFDPCHHPAAYLAAAAAGLALTALAEHERADHLSVALNSNRQIGAAMGILMAANRCSYDEAFAALRVTSQHTHRKLRDIADEVIFTGALPAKAPTAG